jgi:hypothetical protein
LEDSNLGAKRKLNSLYFQVAVVMAGVAGLLTQSWTVFFVVLALLTAASVVSGDIRP